MRSVIEQHADLHWFVVLNATCDDNIMQAFYEQQGSDAQGLWLGTQYEDWREVMPRIAAITTDHPFVEWALSDDAPQDWGMLVASPFAFNDVRDHLQSLTQVWMPNVQHVFFRFYDPRFGIKVATLCDDTERKKLMGPTAIWLAKETYVENGDPAVLNKKEFPWWNVPESVVKGLSEDPSVLITNLLNGLSDYSQALYEAYPEPVLHKKAQRFVAHYNGPEGQYLATFIESIKKEQHWLGNF